MSRANLCLLPFLAAGLCCSRAQHPHRVRIQGRVLGADGAPVPMAHVRVVDQNPFEPAVMVPADAQGRFQVEASLKPGRYVLDFAGVGHPAFEAMLWVEGDRTFQVEARLGRHLLREPLADLTVVAQDDAGGSVTVPLQPQGDGTWAADVQAKGSRLSYRVTNAVNLARGVPFRFGINGTQAEGYEPTRDHNYSAFVSLKDGRARIVFDPRKLPQGDREPSLAFEAKDADLAACWQVDRDRAAIMHVQTERADPAEDTRARYQRVMAFRKGFAQRWEAAFATEQRPLVRQALGAALLIYGNKDTSLVLKAFPSSHPFWQRVADLELGIALTTPGGPSGRELLDIALKQLPAKRAEMLLTQSLVLLKPEQVDALLAELEARHPGHGVVRAVREQRRAESARLAPGQRFPGFQVASLEDSKVSYTLETFRGKTVLVDFWATWCGPCVGELSAIHTAHAAHKGRGLEVLSLSLDRSRDAIASLRHAGKLPMPWKHALLEGGTDHPLCRTLGVKAIPSAFLLGPDGTILASGDSLRGAALERTLDQVLRKP